MKKKFNTLIVSRMNCVNHFPNSFILQRLLFGLKNNPPMQENGGIHNIYTPCTAPQMHLITEFGIVFDT